MKRSILLTCAVLVTAVVLTACAPGANELLETPDAGGHVAGFWRGLWHGVIAPITFVISLFTRSVQVYEVHNNGGWYNFGFLFGMSIVFGGSGGAGCAATRTQRGA